MEAALGLGPSVFGRVGSTPSLSTKNYGESLNVSETGLYVCGQ